MVASSQPCMGILRCESRVVISLDLAASACCPCWIYAGDTRLLAKVRLAEFMLRTASYTPHARFIHAKGAGYISSRCSDHHSAKLQATACMSAVRDRELAEWLEAYARRAHMLLSRCCRQGLMRRPDTYTRVLPCMQMQLCTCIMLGQTCESELCCISPDHEGWRGFQRGAAQYMIAC